LNTTLVCGTDFDVHAWVEEKTNGLIKELINNPSMCAFVLAVTTLFDGKFVHAFPVERTRKYPFLCADKTERMVDMMMDEKHKGQFWTNPDTKIQYMALPYENGTKGVFILPPPEITLVDVLCMSLLFSKLFFLSSYSISNFFFPYYKTNRSCRKRINGFHCHC